MTKDVTEIAATRARGGAETVSLPGQSESRLMTTTQAMILQCRAIPDINASGLIASYGVNLLFEGKV